MNKKQQYIIPSIHILKIEDDFMEMSLAVFDKNNPNTNDEDMINNGSEILNNKSIWSEEY